MITKPTSNTDSPSANDSSTSDAFQTAQTLTSHHLLCRYTGIRVATINAIKVAGHAPYISQWKDTQTLHPLMSLSLQALLQFAGNSWADFCNLSQEQAAETALVAQKEQMLRITALALLHKLSDVEQSVVWMPALTEVSSCWSSLLPLAHWKNHLASSRFSFPTLRVSANNQSSIDLQAYLQACWRVKKDYEGKVRELDEQAKLQAAEAALVSIRSEALRQFPRSKKLLWRWFCINMPKRYAKDLDDWMWEIYDAETDDEVSQFTIADIDLFEEITLCNIPTGTSISHAFLERIANKRKMLETKYTTFEILVPDAIIAEQAAGLIADTEPVASNFPSKVAFMIAHAKWKLSRPSTLEGRDRAIAKQATVTVQASYRPVLDLGDATIEPDAIGLRPVDLWQELGASTRADVPELDDADLPESEED